MASKALAIGAYKLYQKHVDKKSEKLERGESRGSTPSKKVDKDALIAEAVGIAVKGVKAGFKAVKKHREKGKMGRDQQREHFEAETGRPSSRTEELVGRRAVTRNREDTRGNEEVLEGTEGDIPPPPYEQVCK